MTLFCNTFLQKWNVIWVTVYVAILHFLLKYFSLNQISSWSLCMIFFLTKECFIHFILIAELWKYHVQPSVASFRTSLKKFYLLVKKSNAILYFLFIILNSQCHVVWKSVYPGSTSFQWVYIWFHTVFFKEFIMISAKYMLSRIFVHYLFFGTSVLWDKCNLHWTSIHYGHLLVLGQV